jgi:hypothetical protein
VKRYVIAAGLAASEVGALMIVLSIIGLVAGAKSPRTLVDVLLLAGFSAWLWWRRSLIAAGFMLAMVVFEYSYLAYNTVTSATDNSWLTIYLILFLVAFFTHARKPKEVTPSPVPQRDELK